MNKTNVMLDLETLGTSPNSVIVSIGAVKFILDPTKDSRGGKIIEEFYHRIDIQSCINIGLEMSVDTVLWWMRQSDEARSEFQKPTVDIHDALGLFSSWLSDDPKNIDVWGNGSDFDNVLLANAYKACGRQLPWCYFNNRCFRTLKNLYQDVPTGDSQSGTKHNALDDAKSQTWRLMEILTHINKSNPNADVPVEVERALPSTTDVLKSLRNYKKETVRIALPPRTVLDKVLKGDTKLSLVGKYDDVAYEKAYNTPCGTHSSDDNIKGMKAAREADKAVDKTKK